MVNIEIVIGVIAIGVLIAVFIPLTFDPSGAPSGITIIQFNQTDLLEISQFDNFEWARAGDFLTQGSNNPKFAVDTFDEYKVEILKYKQAGAQGNNEFAHWTSAIPSAFNASSAVIDIDIYWYKDVEGNEGGVCWGLSFLGIGQNDTLDQSFGIKKTNCSGTNIDFDRLDIVNVQFNATEHQLAGKEWTSLQVTREFEDDDDTLNKDAHFLGARIIWQETGS